MIFIPKSFVKTHNCKCSILESGIDVGQGLTVGPASTAQMAQTEEFMFQNWPIDQLYIELGFW